MSTSDNAAHEKAFIQETWDPFCERLGAMLKRAGRDISDTSRTVLDRDEGLRVLLRQLQHSMEREIEDWDVAHPEFAPVYTRTYRTLADPPEYASFDAPVAGDREYLLQGRVGNANDVSFVTMAPRAATLTGGDEEPHLWAGGGAAGADRGAGKAITGALHLSECDVDAKGQFSVFVSRERRRPGPWLPMTSMTNRIVARNIFYDIHRDHRCAKPTELSLICLGAAAIPDPFPTHALAEGLDRVLEGVTGPALGRGKIFGRIEKLGNGRFSNDDLFWKKSGSNPRTHFQEAFWDIATGEAMVIEMDAEPSSAFWTVGLTNAWMESLDFHHAQVSLNSHTAKRGRDGVIRIVVSPEDPGVDNWLHTLGHRHGAIIWRWNDIDEKPPLPRSTFMKLSELYN